MFLIQGLNDVIMRRLLLIGGAVPIPLLFCLNVEETYDPSVSTATVSQHSIQQWRLSLDVFRNQLSVGFSSPSFGMYLLGTSMSWFFADILHCEYVLSVCQAQPQNICYLLVNPTNLCVFDIYNIS